jgi:hypothetical protein
MKTQVIHLEPHDDVISVRDKMSWAKTERILLVIPRATHLHARKLDLRLLLRHAGSVGARLAIVTRSDELRRIAEELGIPVFGRLTKAQRTSWPETQASRRANRRRKHPDLQRMRTEAFPAEAAWRGRYGVRLTFFTLAVLAVFAVPLLFLPSASIHLSPTTHLQSLEFAATASAEITKIDLQGRLPARQASLILEQTKTIPATGSISLPDSRAKGTVQFRNLTTSAVAIPAGTMVSDQSEPAFLFTTTVAANIPAGFGKTINVTVQAVKPGSGGNLPADSLVAIQADLGASLSVTNPEPLSGGSDRMATIPTNTDRAALHTALMADILDTCRTELQSSLASGDVLFPGALTVAQTLTESYFPAEGQAGDTLSLTLRIQCQAQYASTADITSLAEMLLDVNLPEGYIPVPGGLITRPASLPVTGREGTTHWEVHAESLLQARVEPQDAIQLSLGRSPEAAAQRLAQSLPLSGRPVIQVNPDWWPWLPLVPFNITVSTGG